MGTVPAWFTLLAVIIALATLVIGRLDAARQQAANVYAIVVASGSDEPAQESTPFTEVVVFNDGDSPIFEPSVQLWDWGKVRRFTWRFFPIEHWLTSERQHWANGKYVPPQARTDSVSLKGLGARTYNRKASPTPPIVLVFRDGNGRLWVRWPNGRLKRVAPSAWRETWLCRFHGDHQAPDPAKLTISPACLGIRAIFSPRPPRFQHKRSLILRQIISSPG